MLIEGCELITLWLACPPGPSWLEWFVWYIIERLDKLLWNGKLPPSFWLIILCVPADI